MARRGLAGGWGVLLCRPRCEVATSGLRASFMCPMAFTMTGQFCKDPVHPRRTIRYHFTLVTTQAFLGRNA